MYFHFLKKRGTTRKGASDGPFPASVGVEVEEPDAPGAAAGSTDGIGVDADDLAELADDHEFAGLVDEVGAGDLADLEGGLHVEVFCRSFLSVPRPEILKPGFN
jgi:hypothetical protein